KPISLGSLNAGPENVAPKGDGSAPKLGGTAAGLGKKPAGTITLGYPARAGGLAPKFAGKRAASNFLPVGPTGMATTSVHSAGTIPVYSTSRPHVLVSFRSSARSARYSSRSCP